MALRSSALIKRAKGIRLLGMDIDGVLTAGDVIVLESGEEVKAWNVRDRLGLALLHERKIPLVLAWVTGRTSNTVLRSARDLGVRYVVQGCDDKKTALTKILKKEGLRFDQAAFIGDDLIDLPPLLSVGLSCCPADAILDVKKRVHYVSPYPGGRGVARDVMELILKAQHRWDPLVRSFLS
jgi:3-deoxy-D-manno-octulosonate 8-phosphate phosphatase (KDO 8-P phosphatase)